ncbi:MAG: ABC transporter permease [Actinobacteria bacterium]|nr:ABC transporter permease [Actinomycetota bacterium]
MSDTRVTPAGPDMPEESYAYSEKRTRELTKGQVRRARILGVVMLVLAAAVVLLLIPGTTGVATFDLSLSDEQVQLAPLAIPSTGALYILAMVLAFLGATQFFRGFQGKATIILGISFGVFVIAVMIWATAGEQFNLTSMLVSTVARSTPIALGALSGILCERAGVVNIGIEGMLLGGAFTGVVFGSLIGGWVGLLAATIVGGILALLLAVLAINFRVDQIIIGVVINLLILSLTSFLTAQLLVEKPEWNDAPIFPAIKIPILGDIPILGPVLFDQTIMVYAMYVLIGLTTWFLFRTRWGLRTRAVGENPRAADSLGVSVYKTRYLAVIYGGMVGGFAGAWFTLGTVGRFDEGMTGGRGFIGLAAMIFGAWNPIGAFAAALIFGFSDSLQQKLAIIETPIPGEFLAMAPYLVTIIVVAGLVGRVRPPAADGQPYEKQ